MTNSYLYTILRLLVIKGAIMSSREELILSLGGLIHDFIRKKRLIKSDDLIQHFWEYAIRAVNTHDPEKGALSTHVHWHLMDAMKRLFFKKHLVEYEEYDDAKGASTPRADLQIQIEELFAHISDDRYRQSLSLRVMGYTIPEIAEIIDETYHNARYFVRKGREELRELNGLE